MKKIQTLVDRESLDSDYIASKQDFESVCTQVKQLTPTWKTPWFYGPVGLATLAVCFSVVTLSSSNVSAKLDSEKEVLVAAPTQEAITEKTSEQPEKTAVAVVPSTSVEKQIQPSAPSVNEDSEEIYQVPVIEIVEENFAPAIEIVVPVVEKRTVSKDNTYPHIAGYFTGDLPVSILFDADGIQLREGIDIVSFDLNYYNGKGNVVESIRGNLIPENLKTIMENHNLGSMLFITNIKAVDEQNRLFVLPALNYKLVKK